MSKIIMLLIGVVTFVLCQFPGGPTYLFAFANCWLVPPAILLGLGAIWPRFNGRGALWGAVCGMATMAVFTLLDLTKCSPSTAMCIWPPWAWWSPWWWR